VCLDTGINDSNPIDSALNAIATYLDDGQARWARVMIEDGKQKNLKTMMMSHHQLFTRSDKIAKPSEGVNPHLYATFKELLPDIHAWFWGHGHSLSIFEPFLGLRRGRLIGNGAVPKWSSVDVFAHRPDIDWSKYGGTPPTLVPRTVWQVRLALEHMRSDTDIVGFFSQGRLLAHAAACYRQVRGARARAFRDVLEIPHVFG